MPCLLVALESHSLSKTVFSLKNHMVRLLEVSVTNNIQERKIKVYYRIFEDFHAPAVFLR